MARSSLTDRGPALLAVIVVLAACGPEPGPRSHGAGDREARSVDTAELVAHETLLLTIDACDTSLEVDVEEADDRVLVTVHGPLVEGGEPDCQVSTAITLETPLRERVVIDGTTDEEVLVSRRDE